MSGSVFTYMLSSEIESMLRNNSNEKFQLTGVEGVFIRESINLRHNELNEKLDGVFRREFIGILDSGLEGR